MEVLIAAGPDILKFETALLVILTVGFFVMAKIVADLRAELKNHRAGEKPATEKKPAPSSSRPAADPSISPEVFVAIVSAIHCTLGERHRVVSVSSEDSLMWSREGRRSIFRSHSFR